MALICACLLALVFVSILAQPEPSCNKDIPPPRVIDVLESEPCLYLRDVCIDQQQFVTYDLQYQPSHTTQPTPRFSIKDLTYNWPNPKGNGDKYVTGKQIHYPPIVIRANTSEEACNDLRAGPPAFDECTVPLIFWSRWPYNMVEAFSTIYARLLNAIETGSLISTSRIMPVMATPHGLRAPVYLETFMRVLFTRRMTTLAQLSDRGGGCGDGSASSRRALSEVTLDSNPPYLSMPNSGGRTKASAKGAVAASGSHTISRTMGEADSTKPGRCFKELHLCKLKTRYDKKLVSAARSLAEHYKDQIQKAAAADPDPWSVGSGSGSESGVLRVVFASRLDMDSRTLLNEADLLSKCNAWKAPQHRQDRRGRQVRASQIPQVSHENENETGRSIALNNTKNEVEGKSGRHLALEEGRNGKPQANKAWRSTSCTTRVFGSGPKGMLSDVSFMEKADVLVCVHGAACGNAYFMRNGSSLVEIRPAGMSPNWANAYFFRQLQQENLVHWYGVDIRSLSNSKPSLLEEQRSAVLNHLVRARERHVRLPWEALKHHLDLIAWVGGDPNRYSEEALGTGALYIDDALQHVPERPREGPGSAA